MSASPYRVRVEVLEGLVETLGIDRFRGAHPSAFQATYNRWGPDGLTFTLKRDPTIDQPDLNEFTPITLEQDGRTVWSGFIIDTPGGLDELTVSALGWQYHLDDDLFTRTYVHSNLADWVDTRTLSDDIPLGNWPSHYVVTQEAGGTIRMGHSQGQVVINATAVGITLDLAKGDPDAFRGNDPRRIAVRIRRAPGPPPTVIYMRAHRSTRGNEFISAGGFEDFALPTTLSTLTTAEAGQWLTGSINGTGFRYVTVFIYQPNATYTAATDDTVQIQEIRLATSSEYLTGSTVSLTASGIIRDALRRTSPLLARDPNGEVALRGDAVSHYQLPDVSRITNTALTLPHYAFPGEWRTARDVMESVNAFHAWRLYVDAERRLNFKAQSDTPVLAVTAGRQGTTFKDASTNNGRDVYNRVIARGRTGSGRPLTIVRHSDGGAIDLLRLKQLDNSSATVDTAGWTAGAGTLTRDTGSFFTAPASFRLTSNVGSNNATATAQITSPGLVQGRRYRIRTRVLLPSSANAQSHRRFTLEVDDGTASGLIGAEPITAGSDPALGAQTPTPENTWVTLETIFTPTAIPPGFLRFIVTGSHSGSTGVAATVANFDDVEITELWATTPDRRRFNRARTLEASFPIDSLALIALAEAWLAAHQKAPLKGELELVSDDVVKLLPDARPVAVSELHNYLGELVLIDNLIDPDTGHIGRIGIIAGVTLRDDGATLTLDNERGVFEALLARMGVVVS